MTNTPDTTSSTDPNDDLVIHPIPAPPADLDADRLATLDWVADVLKIAEANGDAAIARAMADPDCPTEAIHHRSPYSRGKNNSIARRLGVPPRPRGGNR